MNKINNDPEKEMRLMAQMATTTPSGNGESPLPKRSPRGLLPSTWTGHAVKIEYMDGSGAAVTTTGVLADFFAFGPILRSVEGGKVALSWDRISLVELIND